MIARVTTPYYKNLVPQIHTALYDVHLKVAVMISRIFTKFSLPFTYAATEQVTTTAEQPAETTQINTRTTTVQTEINMLTTQTLPCPSTNTPIVPLIATALTVALLATIIVVALHIPLYVRNKCLLRSTNVSKETAAKTENVTYEQIDETKFGTFLNLQQNEAYATSRVTG